MELRGALAALLHLKAPQVLIEGRAGTSKTTGVCLKILNRCEAFPGSRHLIVRETRASLTDSVLVTLERVMGPSHPEVTRMQRAQRHSYNWHGSEIVVGGLDRPEKLFSTEWDTVYMAEATECSYDAWDLFGRAMRHNKTDYHQRIADCNPGPPAHWLNQKATAAADPLRDLWKTRADYNKLQAFNHWQERDPSRPLHRLISVHPDNPAYWDADLWRWTPLGHEYVEQNLAGMTGHRRARMFDGRWKAAEGVVFPEFDEVRHVVREPFKIPSDWPVYVGWDPGYDHPTAILWFAVAPNGCLYIFDEIYQGGQGVPEHVANIRARNAGRDVRGYYADPQHAFSTTAQSPKSIATQARECGLRLFPWPRTGTSEESMVEAVRTRLKQTMLKVFVTCPSTISEFQTWSFKRDAKGELPPGEDKYEDKNNDAMDVVKGIVAVNPKFSTGAARVLGAGVY